MIFFYRLVILCLAFIKITLSNIDFDQATIQSYYYILREWKINSFLLFFYLITIGFTGVIGFLCLFNAYNIGSPSAIAPFEYIIILWAILISRYIWHETLQPKAYLGLTFIIMAGIYTFVREAKLKKQLSINKPLR